MALSEFRTKKMTHVLSLADLDGDGSITYKDFTLFRDKLEAQGAIAPKGTAKYDRLQAELMAPWNNMREQADTGRDEKDRPPSVQFHWRSFSTPPGLRRRLGA